MTQSHKEQIEMNLLVLIFHEIFVASTWENDDGYVFYQLLPDVSNNNTAAMKEICHLETVLNFILAY